MSPSDRSTSLAPSLSHAEFRQFCDFFSAHAGLSFSKASFYTFERRLGERVVELGFSTFQEYYTNLRFNKDLAEEVELALDLITTAETYFFRQEYQLTSFKDELLPRLKTELAARRKLTIWSAGCSTGEEVYTIAMLVQGSGLFDDWDVRVVGSDLSRTRVAIARRGIYSESSFRVTDADQRDRYFVREDTGWKVRDEVRIMCHFGQLNLLDRMVASVGRVDVVFCRNVLIYFGSSARAQVIDNLYRRLRPGGYLLLGHSESLVNVSTAFELVHLSGDLVYRKPPAGTHGSGSGNGSSLGRDGGGG